MEARELKDLPRLSFLLPKSGGLVVQRLYRGRMVLNLPPVNGGETLQDWPRQYVLSQERMPGRAAPLPWLYGTKLVVQRLYRGCMVLNLPPVNGGGRFKTGPDCLSSSPRAEAWPCSASTVAVWY